MRLLFRQVCKCSLSVEDLPSPKLKVTSGFDTDDPTPEIHLSLDMICPKCSKPWESFAGLQYLPKKPKSSLIIP